MNGVTWRHVTWRTEWVGVACVDSGHSRTTANQHSRDHRIRHCTPSQSQTDTNNNNTDTRDIGN